MVAIAVHSKIERIAGKINARLRVLAVSLRAEQVEFSRFQLDDKRAFRRERSDSGPPAPGHRMRRAPLAQVARSAAVIRAFVLRMRGVITVPDIANANYHRVAGVS